MSQAGGVWGVACVQIIIAPTISNASRNMNRVITKSLRADVQSITWERPVIPGSNCSSRLSTRPTDTAFCQHQSPCGAFRQALYRQ